MSRVCLPFSQHSHAAYVRMSANTAPLTITVCIYRSIYTSAECARSLMHCEQMRKIRRFICHSFTQFSMV